MNTLRLSMNAPLNLLTPVVPGVYELIAKFYDGSGVPLNSAYIDNIIPVLVETASNSFDLDIPITNATFSITNAQLRIFAQDGGCCFARRLVSFTNTITLNPNFQQQVTSPTCDGETIVPGYVRLFNVTNATRYKVCYNTSTFNCTDCETSDGVINGSGDTIITLNIPPENSSYEFTIRIYNGPSCSFYSDMSSSQNWISCDSGVIISPQAVLLSGGVGGGKVFRYEPSTGDLAEVYDAGSFSPDIAHTSNKMFFLRNVYNGSAFVSRLSEYNITLNPFSQAFVRNYDITDPVSGAGLCAVSNTELYIGYEKVIKVIISGTTATPTDVFSLPVGYHCSGDLVYDPATDLFLISYDNTADFKIGVFEGATGTLVRSGTAPTSDIYGIYQFAGNTFIVSGSGSIYHFNLTTMVSNLVGTVGTTITGASQIQANISIPS